jgi:hypothetical protein
MPPILIFEAVALAAAAVAVPDISMAIVAEAEECDAWAIAIEDLTSCIGSQKSQEFR